MRIAYVCYWDARRPDGVAAKIASQLDAWRTFGHEAELFVLTPGPRDGVALRLRGRPFAFAGRAGQVLATRRLDADVRAWRPDVVYLRYDLFVPPPLRTLGAFPAVVEINSNLAAELEARSRTAALYERIQRPLIFRRAAGAVCVTHELAATLSAERPSLPLKVIANGIALAGIEPFPAPAGAAIQLAYLGEGIYWQGVDKIFELAAAVPEWKVDLIGVDPSRSTANVTCHGFLEREAYEPILARADVAIGTLALHRKGMNEACALKTRLYLAYGLPVVLGHEDTDFLGADPWFLFRLPNTETNVRDNIDRIRSFAAAVKGRRVHRSEIEGHLSASVKEAQRIDFLQRQLAGDHPIRRHRAGF
jgi:glycosyltransferase involved in cell wall biosynthesis